MKKLLLPLLFLCLALCACAHTRPAPPPEVTPPSAQTPSPTPPPAPEPATESEPMYFMVSGPVPDGRILNRFELSDGERGALWAFILDIRAKAAGAPAAENTWHWYERQYMMGCSLSGGGSVFMEIFPDGLVTGSGISPYLCRDIDYELLTSILEQSADIEKSPEDISAAREVLTAAFAGNEGFSLTGLWYDASAVSNLTRSYTHDSRNYKWCDEENILILCFTYEITDPEAAQSCDLLDSRHAGELCYAFITRSGPGSPWQLAMYDLPAFDPGC